MKQLGILLAVLYVASCSASPTSAINGGGNDAGSGTDAAGNPTDGGDSADSSTQPPVDGGADSGDAGGVYDFGCGGNMACLTTTECCAAPGTPTTFSCAPPGTCNPADKILCDGPDECGGAKPVCCGVEVANGTGNYPTCNAASLGTSCTTVADCATHLGTTCNDTTKVVICHVAADCTDSTNNKCCTFTTNGANLTFCTDSITAALGGAACH